ncbi:hypothetical protein OH492_24920 [Vibrio chagasii]|nr:hypothetical protein [Vibrio chagasii]
MGGFTATAAWLSTVLRLHLYWVTSQRYRPCKKVHTLRNLWHQHPSASSMPRLLKTKTKMTSRNVTYWLEDARARNTRVYGALRSVIEQRRSNIRKLQ